jgi:hypothetical protein
VSGFCVAQSVQPGTDKAALTADAIMARVAANQDNSEELRKEYVYKQRIHIVTHKPKGRLIREETADYDVVPMPEGTQKELKLLTGRYWHKGKYEDFQGEPVPEADSMDGDLIHAFRNDLSNEKSKDGLARDLFPLTTEEQKAYEFKLLGQEIQQGRNVYHIGFQPKNKGEITWAGEAYIDAADFQPVRVFTKLSRRIPLTCPASGSTWSTTGSRTESGFLPASERNSGCTRSFLSIATSQFRSTTRRLSTLTCKRG